MLNKTQDDYTTSAAKTYLGNRLQWEKPKRQTRLCVFLRNLIKLSFYSISNFKNLWLQVKIE